VQRIAGLVTALKACLVYFVPNFFICGVQLFTILLLPLATGEGWDGVDVGMSNKRNRASGWIVTYGDTHHSQYRVISNRICPARGSTLNQINGSAARKAQINNISMRRVMAVRPAASQYVQHDAGTIAQ
jgi:hypothetical protein